MITTMTSQETSGAISAMKEDLAGAHSLIKIAWHAIDDLQEQDVRNQELAQLFRGAAEHIDRVHEGWEALVLPEELRDADRARLIETRAFRARALCRLLADAMDQVRDRDTLFDLARELAQDLSDDIDDAEVLLGMWERKQEAAQ